jgi:S1-C subfamily serine protease
VKNEVQPSLKSSSDRLQDLYHKYSVCMVRITVTTVGGEIATGAGFHIGDGWIVTARHVIEAGDISEVNPYKFSDVVHVQDVILSSDETVDLAILRTDFNLERYMSEQYQLAGVNRPWKEDHIPIGGHFDDWLGDEFILSKVLIMGYPIIPQSNAPNIVAVSL